MKKKLSKTQAKNVIEEFFLNIASKSPKEIRKIKRLSMAYNIPLSEKRKLFCRKCFFPYSGKEKIRIKDKIKSIACKNCEYISRWKVK